MISIFTTCPICGHENEIQVYPEDYLKWQAGALVQDAFPYLSADDREMLISGICPNCWDKMFNDEEAEEDEPDFEDDVDECGYDPYLGCYTEDC